ncbi:MAG: uncharacterized protein PWP46_1281 [Fusobacteriaceae bacterium]|jgi:uncharacterized cupin superfamily protein|nr:cupin [Fusobacteriales bacterium]MDN5304397.1 uncharacterized protein [Fusobacteriaceae bacterium]
MEKILVQKLTDDELNAKNVFSWPIWTKEKSKFDWHYDSIEECYILKGKIKVTTDNEEVVFGKGDFVTFPKGLSCVWEVIEDVRKHYNFK